MYYCNQRKVSHCFSGQVCPSQISCPWFRISRSAKQEIDIASVLKNIDANDIENLHLLDESNNTDATDINPDNEIVEKITEKPSPRIIPQPKVEAQNCFIFDEETFELVNLCPDSTK